MPKQDALRIAVLGAGPIGLEAALYARRLDYHVTVYERGRVGEHMQQWGHVKLFSPFGMNVSLLGRQAIRSTNPHHDFPDDSCCLTGLEHVESYLQPLAQTPLIQDSLRTSTEVVSIGRRDTLKQDNPGSSKRGQEPFRLLVAGDKGKEESALADVVIDCTGTYGRHRWLGDGGIPAVGERSAEPSIAYTLENILGEQQAKYAGQTVMVVGKGYSAATTVSRLAKLAEQHPETWIIWLARRAVSQPLKRIANDPLRERDRLAMHANALATRGEGNVEFHPQTVVEAVENAGPDKGFRVSARSEGKPHTWEVDRLIANVGYAPDASLYRELQVHECYASQGPMNLAAALLKHAGADCLSIPGAGAETLRNPEPNFYILGAKSYGRNSNFLLRNGFEQVRDVFRLITGKGNLDLYVNQR